MSNLMTRPQGMIPLGWVTINGTKHPVRLEVEWDRYLTILDARAGGITGLGTADVDAGYFAVLQQASPSDGEAMHMTLQPMQGGDVFLADILQTGGECCLTDMTFQR